MLWDLLAPVARRLWERAAGAHAAPALVEPKAAPPAPASGPSSRKPKRRARSAPDPVAHEPVARRPVTRDNASERYHALVQDMLATHKVKVRKWRTSMSGIAWQQRVRGGGVIRMIEAPRPKGPMSAAVFLHEIGHHAIGFNTFKPRCLEEYHAWAWALRAMEERGILVSAGVRRRMHRSLEYALAKAARRGLKAVPPELMPYTRPYTG